MTFYEWWKDQWQFFDAATHIDKRGVALAAWEAAQPKWRPIETAPKDKKILVLLKSGSVIQAEYWDAWRPAYFSDSKLDPICWMPSPALPKEYENEF